MKMVKSVLPKALMIFLIFSVVCGILYSGVVTGLAQLLFPDKANGSIIEVAKSTAASFWASNIWTMPICGAEL